MQWNVWARDWKREKNPSERWWLDLSFNVVSAVLVRDRIVNITGEYQIEHWLTNVGPEKKAL